MSPELWVVYATAISLGMAWFWLHCAEPTLRATSAPQLAVRIVLAVTIIGMAAQVLRATIVVLDEDSILFYGGWMAASFAWVAVVGYGYLSKFTRLIGFCRAVGREPNDVKEGRR